MKKITVIYDQEHILHQPLTYPSVIGLEEYPEKPARVETIIQSIHKETYFEVISPDSIDDSPILEIHDKDYIYFLQSLENKLHDNAYHYPTQVFHGSSKPHDNIYAELGRHSYDLSAPVDKHIYKQAIVSAACAYTGAKKIKSGYPVIYSVSRPPGHHAMKNKMGGFCYINSTALAADYLSQSGKVAVLDVDYHHGNGTQDIFYDRNDVYTISIHASPRTDYPYYWGFENEYGSGNGNGFNRNFPLQHGIDSQEYQNVLLKAVKLIVEYKPQFLVVAFGLDTYEKDPLGSFKLTTEYYREMAKTIRQLNIPTLIVQEGGYHIESLGINVLSLLRGFI